MKINLSVFEIIILYLHLKEYLDDNSRNENSDDIFLKSQYLTLKNIVEKLKSKIGIKPEENVPLVNPIVLKIVLII